MDEEMKAPAAAAVAPPPAPSAVASDEKRFEIKKWNAVALWSWGAYPRHGNGRFWNGALAWEWRTSAHQLN